VFVAKQSLLKENWLEIALEPALQSYVTLLSIVPVAVGVMPMVAVIAMPAVPIIRPIIARVPIRSVGIAVRIVVSMWVVSVVTRASEPN
jgi:hypothetical protein